MTTTPKNHDRSHNSNRHHSHSLERGNLPELALQHPFMSLNAVTLLLALLVAAVSMTPRTAGADVYRWVEADGTVNYGEREPRDREFTVVSRSPSKQSAGKTASNRPANNRPQARPSAAPVPDIAATPEGDNLSDRQRAMLERLKADEARRQEGIAEIRKSNCEVSKRVLTKMQDTRRIRVRDKNGEEVAISDDERNERISEAQKSIAVNCDSLS